MPAWISKWLALAVLLVVSAAPAQSSWETAPADGTDAATEVDDVEDDSDGDAAQPAPTPANDTAPGAAREYSDTDPAALTDFNSELAPHGSWIDDPTYGRVWVPNEAAVGSDFAPYVTNGHWARADDGEWMWVSDYPFGWVVFHYGRWVWIAGTGWAWIPGRQYAHAWVVWRVPEPGVYYVGWAPMPPSFVWVNGVAWGVGFGVYTPWVFCPSAYVYSYNLHRHIVHDRRYVNYLGNHTRRYRPPRGAAPYRGPRPKQAHIPAHAVPKQHTPANPKAKRAARGSQARHIPPPTRTIKRKGQPGGAQARAIPRGARPSASASGARPSSGRSAPTTRRAAPSNVRRWSSSPTPRAGAPARASGPTPLPRRTAPTSTPRHLKPVPAPRARPAPAPRAAPSYRSRPQAQPRMRSYSSPPARSPGYAKPSRSRSYSKPSRSYSAPARSYSPPSRSSAPARSYSAPSRSYSAPSRSYSAPSRRSGGFGRSGGFSGRGSMPRGRGRR